MMFTKSKVKFQDQQLDDYVLENSVLQSKLQSKIEALSIMSKELDKCHMERDRYRVLVDQLKSKNILPTAECFNTNMYKHSQNISLSGGEILAKTREQNNILRLEVESLRSKLDESIGDTSALRKQLQLFEYNPNHKGNIFYENKNYEDLVQQLENIQKKYRQLELDYRATLDEKEELTSDRDYYKTKVMRLNHQISYTLNNQVKSQGAGPPKPVVDIDSLITENKYLHERITQLQVEKEIVTRNLSKYKHLLENKNKSDNNNIRKGLLDIMTQKQVREFFDTNNSKGGLKRSSVAELKSLCLGLFESLNDKSIALQHQRKTNQILANRITELEKTLESWCNGERYVPIFPSQMLLDDILPDCEPDKFEVSDMIDDKSSDNHDMENDSEDENKDMSGDSSSDTKSQSNKIVLPHELEELVKEALAELKTIN